MKRLNKKLSLNKETLRSLTSDEQLLVMGGDDEVVGSIPTSIWSCWACTTVCPTSFNGLCGVPSAITLQSRDARCMA